MSYVNLNNPANFQLQEFEQLGFRYIVSGRPSIGGETYRTLFVLEEAVVTTTSLEGDSFSSETLAAGTVIHGFFSGVSTTSGALLAYKAGPITAQEIWDFYRAYVESNGGVIEGESCAVTEIAALLAEGLYSMASLVLIPSGYKTGVVYSERPTTTDGQLTFTRNSNATRVNSEGLVEKVRQNVLLYSNDFSNAAFGKINASLTGGQADKDGGTSAWKWAATSAATAQLTQGVTIGGNASVSIYAKAGNRNTFSIWVGVAVSFDLSSGTVTAGNGKIESVGGGWYRCTAIASTSYNSFNPFFAASATGEYIYIQNGMHEVSDFGATDYIATTSAAVSVGPTANVPRLDYSGGATCGKLLLEPQCTALNQYSEQIDNAYWTKTDVTIVANTTATLDPSGYNGADKITEAATNYFHSFQRVVTTAVSSHTFSVFAKAAERSIAYIEVFTSGAANRTFFDLSNGTIGTSAAGNNPTITDFGNGWYRLSVTRTTSSSSVFIVGITNADNVTQYAGNGTSGAYFWGLNYTQTSYLQSYVPTLGASVTRLADAAYKTGISSLIGQTEGTIYAEIDFDTISEESRFIQLSDGTNNNRFYIGALSTNNINYTAITSGTTIVNISSSAQSSGVLKVAAAYANNDFVLYVNGAQIGADTTGTIPAMSQVSVGYNNLANNRHIAYGVNQALLFKTRLTNAQLATLTTL